ncbi:hypothetical protein P7C71_g12, partial [Lecanoromycetidae sp. Uapishka_2]
MNLKNGSNLSLFGPNQAAAAKTCLEPHFTLLSLSYDMWETFLSISGSTYLYRASTDLAFQGMLIDADGAYDGDLTISLDPGLDIRIPNHQLIVPEYDFNASGEASIDNGTSVREVLIGSLQQVNANDMLVLGLPFFTSAYMLVDNDNEEVTLWQAQASTAQDLVAVGTPDCTPTPSASPTPSPSPSSVLHSAVARATVSGGAIAGAAIGGLIGIAIVVGAFLLVKQRQKKAKNEMDRDPGSSSPEPLTSYGKPELASDQIPPQEMPLVRNTGYRLAPYELSENRNYGELPAEPPPVPEKEGSAVSAIELSTAPKTPKSGRFNRI